MAANDSATVIDVDEPMAPPESVRSRPGGHTESAGGISPPGRLTGYGPPGGDVVRGRQRRMRVDARHTVRARSPYQRRRQPYGVVNERAGRRSVGRVRGLPGVSAGKGGGCQAVIRPACWNWFRAALQAALTVPSGHPSRAAISGWVRPSRRSRATRRRAGDNSSAA